MQSQSFGRATQRGDSADSALTYAGMSSFQPAMTKPNSTAPRANPITWLGGPPEVQPRPRAVDPVSGRSMIAEPPQAPPPPPPQVKFDALSQGDMQQTWSHLVRTGKVRPSAAQCLVDMPPEYSVEPPPVRSETPHAPPPSHLEHLASSLAPLPEHVFPPPRVRRSLVLRSRPSRSRRLGCIRRAAGGRLLARRGSPPTSATPSSDTTTPLPSSV